METSTPTRHRVADSDALADGQRLVLDVGDNVIGIFRVRGKLYAYDNVCAHQGGPACQGRMIDRVVERLADDKRSLGQSFDAEDPHVVCPWHGFEYSIITGCHTTIPKYRLRAFPIHEVDGSIYVTI